MESLSRSLVGSINKYKAYLLNIVEESTRFKRYSTSRSGARFSSNAQFSGSEKWRAFE